MVDVFAIQRLLARYTRYADQRDGAAMAQLFAPDATIEVIYNKGEVAEMVGTLNGHAAIGAAMSAMMQPHPPLGWSHHTTYDPLIEVVGNRATIDTQFITFDVRGAARPVEGWPKGAFGAQGAITPIESGYYRAVLRKTDGEWLFDRFHIHHDLPYVVPA